jgi:Bifunctional DNA primase/polymerase, N-terminal
MHNQKTLVIALAYAAHGWAVFPVPPGTKRSYKSAEHSDGRAWGMTRNAAEIRADFTRWPDAGIGIPTGAVNGIIVVETDTVAGHGIDGSNSLAQLETKHGALPDTLQAISPSGSVHRYFKHPGASIKIISSASELGAGIDVRGDGGMVIAPPTARPDVGVYRWINRNPIAEPPAWLIELTKDKQPPPPKRLSIRERAQAAVRQWEANRRGGNAYADAALEYEIRDLANAADGGRNHALNRSAFSLLQLVHAGQLDRADVERQLIDACIANGLMDDRDNGGINNILRTIRSAEAGAIAKPRTRKGAVR